MPRPKSNRSRDSKAAAARTALPNEGEAPSSRSPYPRPHRRRLRVFAFDPATSQKLDCDRLHQLVLEVPWEGAGTFGDDLLPGPVGEQLEVVDVDPASGLAYPPVDLDDPHLLARDGLAPSTADPQFHQQMVYAVAMRTIRLFEEALGRRTLWADRRTRDDEARPENEFVERLRIYPHAFRAANAYYSPNKVALLFGYFPAGPEADGPGVAPDKLVFTCLSYDIVAHETAHALLDGLHSRYSEPSNRDMLAFHEGFADVVAIFQHFTHREVLEHYIERTSGTLDRAELMASLAAEMGRALGYGDALRNALDPKAPQLDEVSEAHDRGLVLLAALFQAFLAIYRSRTDDLRRIASSGTGVLPPGRIQRDLARRMADEAQKSAEHLLRMAIRALDYCPPVDLDFGDYLRALLTADRDLVPVDERDYRLALVEAFRSRGIVPREVRNLSQESLFWAPPQRALADEVVLGLFEALEQEKVDTEVEQLAALWTLSNDRETIWRAARKLRGRLQRILVALPPEWARNELQLVLTPVGQRSVVVDEKGIPRTEVHSARVARRRGPGNQSLVDLVVEVTQRRYAWEDEELQRQVDRGERERPDHGDFRVRSGCTLLIDLVSRRIRYAIRSRHAIDDDRVLVEPRKTRQALDEIAFDARSRAFAGRGLPMDSAVQEALGAIPREETFSILHGSRRTANAAAKSAEQRPSSHQEKR